LDISLVNPDICDGGLHRFTLGYSFYQMDMTLTGGGQSLFSEGVDPENRVSLRTSFDLPGNVDLDLWTRWVDRLPAFGVDGYFDVDIRVAWRPKRWLELAVVGQNLVDAQHPEFGPDPNVRTQITEVPRGVYGQITARY
jgi:iron complex outermembrane recepter protein